MHDQGSMYVPRTFGLGEKCHAHCTFLQFSCNIRTLKV